MLESLLPIFIALSLCREALETWLSLVNRKFYESQKNQDEACKVLQLSNTELEASLSYSRDRQKFGLISSWLKQIAFLICAGFGAFGWIDAYSAALATRFDLGAVGHGLAFFGILGLASSLLGIPFQLYSQFVIEKKHGFNRQSLGGFLGDFVKGLTLGAVLGGILLSILLKIMGSLGQNWWLAAWIAMSLFSLIAMWIYPRILAPMFNKFTEVGPGELRDGIASLSQKTGFRMGGIFVMDASKRSAHGNAYFTGVFGEKRIVLFDTLIESMASNEVIAVLAHELGHFKLNHVRWGVIRSTISTGVIFYLLSLIMHQEAFYRTFNLTGISSHGALFVFSLWFGFFDFPMQLLNNFISRANEFAADKYAGNVLGESKTLASALLKLREKSHVMPIVHPWYSRVYHSHPPLIERLAAMGVIEKRAASGPI